MIGWTHQKHFRVISKEWSWIFFKIKSLYIIYNFLLFYWFLKRNLDAIGMQQVLGPRELCEKCLMPSLYVESCGRGLFFYIVVKALKSTIKNKEVVRKVSKVLCAFEAWSLWVTISKNIRGLFPFHSKVVFLEVAIVWAFTLLMMYQNFYYKRIRIMWSTQQGWSKLFTFRSLFGIIYFFGGLLVCPDSKC